MQKELYIGLMSGTSMDGIDAALCRIDTHRCTLQAAYTHPFPKSLRQDCLAAMRQTVLLEQIGKLDVRLGELFAQAALELIKHANVSPQDIRAVGLHGQTLWHHPTKPYPFSFQAGNAAVVAERTNIDVVSDFRSNDLARGGEGAPLAPAFHRFIYGNDGVKKAVVNIGGIANITVMSPNDTYGYDIGPGNALIDAWIKRWLHKPYDTDGHWAKSGHIATDLLACFENDDYFRRQPPKSTGKEYFNIDWIQHCLSKHPSVTHRDVQRTLTELTARLIARAIRNANVEEAYLCGGGVRNLFLRERIVALTPSVRIVTSEYAEMMEAMMMAWLAYLRIHRKPVPLASTTGASRNGCLGAVYTV